MTRNRHPIDDVFNVDSFDVGDDDFPEIDNYIDVLPDKDERDLDMVIDYALRQYQSINNMIGQVEPVKRLKYYEVARDFLVQAKDAIHKRDVLKQKKVTKPSKQKESTGESGTSGEGVSRDELAERLKKEKLRRVK